MSTIVWITALFGALVAGTATVSVLDEVFERLEHLHPERWSHRAIPRYVVAISVTLSVMVLWIWFWVTLVAG